MRQAQLQISVVDDEETVRKALERLLRSAGMSVSTFPSGREFIEALPGLKTDCVVLDLHMPNVNGFDVLDHLAQAGNPLPVVIITGHDTPESRGRVREVSVAAYLLKPVDEFKLIDAIASAISVIHK